MRIAMLLLVTVLSACSVHPKDERQIANEQGIKPAADSAPVNSALFDGPFGVAKGEALSSLSKGQELKPGYYKITTVPQPYPNIENYLVENTPQHGTCMVRAVSNDIESDSFGSNLKEAVDHVRDDLVARYGKPGNSYDFLRTGSIWNDPQDWMMGLGKNERTYAYFWNAPKNADPRVWRNVSTIGLSAASDGRKGWFTLEYDFVDGDQCDEDLKHKAAQSL